MHLQRIQVTVILLTWNQRETTLQCLSSLMAVREPEFDIIVWDNGSEDDTEEAVRDKFPTVLVHRHVRNLGVASGRNEAAKLAIESFDPTHLLFLDNDMVVEADFVDSLLKPFGQDDEVGQTQAKLLLLDNRACINDGGGIKINFMLATTRPVGYGEIDHGQYNQMKPCIACGGAMMVRTDVFKELKGFDTLFDPVGPEDIDFSLRLVNAGYSALYVPSAVAYHAVSHTFGKDYSALYASYKTRHWFLFMKRHAPWWERMVFFGITAPFIFLKVVLREAGKGNYAVFKGLFKGVSDVVRMSTNGRKLDEESRSSPGISGPEGDKQ